MYIMRLARALLILSAAAAWPAAAQTAPSWDNSGNGMLNGTYYFRHVVWDVGNVTLNPLLNLNDAVALYGTVTFDGKGNYTMTATQYALGAAQPAAVTPAPTGTYTIAASGQGMIDNPLINNDSIHGVVSKQGVFIGSSTEGAYNDFFLAVPAPSPAATNASFNGSWWLAEMDMTNTSSSRWSSSLFQVSPNGAGKMDITGTGYVAGGSASATQSATGLTYAFNNGAGLITFPNQSTTNLFLYGSKNLYISPDGNFIFGGSPVGFDFFVGVRQATGVPPFSGLYDQAGVAEDVSAASGANGYVLLDTYYGSFSAVPNAAGCPDAGCVIGHQRIQDLQYNNPYDNSYYETFPNILTTSFASSGVNYVVGAGGIRIGSGISPYLTLNVAFPAPAPTGTGVFLNPLGVANDANYAPFTAGIAPGEYLVLYGSNLAPAGLKVADKLPFQNILNGVQVLINGSPVPIYYVSPTQISVLVPYGLSTSIAQIQVVNNSVNSNTATVWVNTTSAGVFTQNQNGLGYAAAQHADFSLLTPLRPAQPGETIQIYLSGLGVVDQTVADGATAPSSPLANVVSANAPSVYIDGNQATVSFAGLSPCCVSLYQLNVVVPSGVTNGALVVATPDSVTLQAYIPVASSSKAKPTALRRAPRAQSVHPRTPNVSRKR